MTRSLEESLAGGSVDGWAIDFLTHAGFHPSPGNVQVVVSWAYAESGAGGGMWNPLNTTESVGAPGETWFNSFGPGGKYHVLNFATRADGIAANTKAIRNGFYPAVVAGLTVGADPRAICDAITRSPWGTGHIALRGTVTPTPAVSKGEPMIVASPHKPTTQGRVAAATWSPENPNVVVLTNGASIAHDVPSAFGTRTWRPPVTIGAHGIGITATVGADGRPDGKGIVLQDSMVGTFIGLWS